MDAAPPTVAAADSGATGNATQPPTESPDQNAAATATPFAMMDPQQQAYLYSYYQSYGYYDPSQYAAMMAAQQPATQTPNVTTATADATSVTPAQTTETPANSTTPASGTAQTQFTPSALPFTTPYAPYGQYPMMPGLPMMGAGAMNPMAGMMMMGGMANPYMRALAAAAASGQQPTKSLWVGNLHPETTEEEIRIAFSGFGPVESIKVLNPKNCAFIKYEDVNSAIQAYGAMLGRSIHGQQIKVGWGKAEPATEEKGPPCRNLWIGNIHPDTTEDDIAALFRQFGAIERVRVIPHKNCAFVNFIHLDACVAAKARMQGKPLKGQPMKLNYGKETTSNFPPMPSQFLKAEELPPPRVPAPTGPEKILVDKLAEFVVKNGLAFEQMMTTKQQENPSPNTSCLTPSDPNHGYYRWRVFEMTMEKNTSELPPLPPLPTAPSAATTTTPPWVTNANAAQTTQQAETQPAVLSDSETSELKALILQSPSQTMQEAKDWITGHIKQIPSISQVLLACIVSATGFDKRYSIMGLINDLLRQGRSNRKVDETTDDISAALKPLLSTVVRLSYLGETQVNQDKLFKLLDQWSDDKVYDPTFIKQLQASAIAAVRLQQIIPVQAIETANRIALGALTEPSKLPTSTTQPLQVPPPQVLPPPQVPVVAQPAPMQQDQPQPSGDSKSSVTASPAKERKSRSRERKSPSHHHHHHHHRHSTHKHGHSYGSKKHKYKHKSHKRSKSRERDRSRSPKKPHSTPTKKENPYETSSDSSSGSSSKKKHKSRKSRGRSPSTSSNSSDDEKRRHSPSSSR